MPAKKKTKKKGDVFARMTVDQRRQYLERKAAQEQERTRRREELLAGFLKLKYQDEKKKASMNEAKLNVKWREILRQVKSDSLIAQLKNLYLWIKETVTSQDAIIELLMKSSEEACQQRTLATQKHLSFVQNMAALHEEYVSLLTHEYRTQEVGLITKSAEGIETATRHHLHQIKRLELTEKAAAESTEEGEKCELTKFKNAVADVKAKLEEEADNVAQLLEARLEDAWFQLASTVKQSETQTRDLREECSILQDKVDFNMKTKHRIDKEVLEMQAEISTWKAKFCDRHQEEALDKNAELVDQGLVLLRNSLLSQRVQARDSIKRSNRISTAVFEQLKETVNLGEEILHLADLCRRQETSEDKNLPYIPTLPPPLIISSIKLSDEEVTAVSDLKSSGISVASEPHLHPYPKGINSLPESSDSGVGTSFRTFSTQQGKNIFHPGPILPSLTEGESEFHDKIDPKTVLSSVTLDRIHKLLQDENALRDIAESLGQVQAQRSEFVMKETELMMRTHESLSHFWCKLNNVEVQRLSLMKEAEDLRQENIALRETLKSFFYSQGLTNKSLSISKSPMVVAALSILERIPRVREEGVKDPTTQGEDTNTKTAVKTRPRFVKPVVEGLDVVRSHTLHNRQLKCNDGLVIKRILR